MIKMQLLIGGTDYASFVDLETLNVDNNVVMTADVANFLIQLDGELQRPRAGAEVIWRTVDTSNGNKEVSREFAGVLVTVNETTEGTSLIYNCTAKSYEHWLDRHLVTAWYNQDLASNIVKAMMSRFCKGFTTNNVQATPGISIIPQYFNYQKPSECLRLIADQLQYGWYIDYYKDLHFYPAEFAVSPLTSNYLNVDNDMYSYGDLELIENGEQVYNKIFLKGFKTRSNSYINLTFPCDGLTAQWSLGYRASSIKGDVSVAVFPSLSAYQSDSQFQGTGKPSKGTLMTIKKDIIEGAPDQACESGIAYIHFTQHLVRVPSAFGSGTLPSGYVVAVHFYYLKDQIFMGQDVSAQNKISKIEGSDGVYEYAQEDKSLTNSTIGAPQAKCELLIRKYGLPQIQGSFTSFIAGWRAGQYFTMIAKKRMGGINKQMYVLRVNKRLICSKNGQFVIKHEIQFADSPYLV